MEIEPLTIELLGGYTDNTGKGVTHKKVTFSKRLTGADYFRIDDDPQSNIPTQYEALILRQAITEFGTLTMPVPLTVLLQLDSIDRDDLNEAYNKFSRESMRALAVGSPEPAASVDRLIDGRSLKLLVGYERNGLVYDLVEFGKRLTGMDEVAADTFSLSGIRRVCFMAGQQVVKLYQSNGASVLEGPMGLEMFERLDAVDIALMKAGAEVWRQSFRLPGRAVSAERPGPQRVAPGAGDGLAGVPDSRSVN
jgi:hypothetical protein